MVETQKNKKEKCKGMACLERNITINFGIPLAAAVFKGPALMVFTLIPDSP